MRYSNKDSIQLTSAEMLQQICEKRLAVRHQRYHRDRNGRAIWSYDIFESIFTYYLYNQEGQPIEVGHTYMPQFTLDKFISMSALPDEDLIDYIVNSYLSYNISLLQPVPQTIAPQAPQHEIQAIPTATTTGTATALLPIHTVGNVPTLHASVDNPERQAQPDPEMIIQHTTDTSFADSLLHIIFSAPNPAAETLQYVNGNIKTISCGNFNALPAENNGILQQPGPIRIRPSPVIAT